MTQPSTGARPHVHHPFLAHIHGGGPAGSRGKRRGGAGRRRRRPAAGRGRRGRGRPRGRLPAGRRVHGHRH
ncbi:hypothetical protein DDE05_10400, partial [Streptomyces cavourensis]